MFSNYTKAGIILLAFAIVTLTVAITTQNSVPTPLAQGTSIENLTIPSHGYSNKSITVDNTSILFVFIDVANRTNIYFMNSTAFSAWSLYVNSNSSSAQGLGYALSIANRGVFYVYQNVTGLVAIPYIKNSSQTQAPLLYPKQNQVFPPGTYYVVFDNTKESASTNHTVFSRLTYLQPISNSTLKGTQFSSVYPQMNQGVQLGIIFIVLLLAGIVILLYGYVKRLLNWEPSSDTTDTGREAKKKEVRGAMSSDIEHMYAAIERKHTGKKGRNGRKRRLK